MTHARGRACSTCTCLRRLSVSAAVIYITLRSTNARTAEGSTLCYLASIHINDKTVAGVLAVVLQDALHVEVLVELPVGVAVAHQKG